MAQKNIPNMIVQHLSNPKNWTKKKFATLGVAVVGALATNYFVGNTGGTTATSTVKKGQTYQAKVVKVADGDTATVTDTHGATHKIRFAFIDAPEKAQAYGMASKDALDKLINGKQVQVYVTDVDRYQREVAVISVNGLDVNYEQVKNGNAWHYQTYAKKNQSPSDFSKYNTAWQQAQSKRIGLWGGKPPQAPWDFRAQQRAGKSGASAEEE